MNRFEAAIVLAEQAVLYKFLDEEIDRVKMASAPYLQSHQLFARKLSARTKYEQARRIVES